MIRCWLIRIRESGKTTPKKWCTSSFFACTHWTHQTIFPCSIIIRFVYRANSSKPDKDFINFNKICVSHNLRNISCKRGKLNRTCFELVLLFQFQHTKYNHMHCSECDAHKSIYTYPNSAQCPHEVHNNTHRHHRQWHL